MTKLISFYAGNLPIYSESSFFSAVLHSDRSPGITSSHKNYQESQGNYPVTGAKQPPKTHHSFLVNPHNSDFTVEENENIMPFYFSRNLAFT